MQAQSAYLSTLMWLGTPYPKVFKLVVFFKRFFSTFIFVRDIAKEIIVSFFVLHYIGG
jgi:hypothetical protein